MGEIQSKKDIKSILENKPKINIHQQHLSQIDAFKVIGDEGSLLAYNEASQKGLKPSDWSGLYLQLRKCDAIDTVKNRWQKHYDLA